MMPLMPSRVRKSFLTVHVLSSVGWVGAVAAFLVLAVAGYTTSNDQFAAGLYVSLRLMTWWLIIPLSVVSLVGGVIQSLGTSWGLLRHYWVVVKLLVTTGATALLFLHTLIIDRAATEAVAGMTGAGASAMKLQLVIDSAAALVVLILITILSTVKPRGITPLGARRGPLSRSSSTQ